MGRGAAVDMVVSEEKKLEGLAMMESDDGVATVGSWTYHTDARTIRRRVQNAHAQARLQ